MVDTLFQLGNAANFPAIKTTLASGDEIVVPLWLVAGLRTYVAAVMNSTAGASKNHIVLFNGSGSNRKVRVWDIRVNANITGNVTGTSMVLNCARSSNNGTGGANETIRKTDTSDSNLPAEVTCVSNRTGVTYTSNELASTTILVEESQAAAESRTILFKADSVIAPLVLNEGEGLGVQQGTVAGVGAINIFMYFTID